MFPRNMGPFTVIPLPNPPRSAPRNGDFGHRGPLGGAAGAIHRSDEPPADECTVGRIEMRLPWRPVVLGSVERCKLGRPAWTPMTAGAVRRLIGPVDDESHDEREMSEESGL